MQINHDFTDLRFFDILSNSRFKRIILKDKMEFRI